MKTWFVVGLGLGISACGATTSARRDAVSSRAAFDLECPADKIETRELDKNVYGALGCDRQATYVLECKVDGCTAVVNSDVTPRMDPVPAEGPPVENSDSWCAQAVLKRAGFDLGCAETQVRVQEIGNQAWGASGCGRKASYVVKRFIDSCKAYMDSSAVGR